MRATLFLAMAGTAVAASLLCDGFTNPVEHPSSSGLTQCVSGFVSVPAHTTANLKFNFNIPQNQTQVTEIFLDDITSGSPFVSQISAGNQVVSGTYDIGATLCMPHGHITPKGVQMLTHGVGFDRRYWDFAPGYSYVDVAASHGYASFFYDRLGVGASSHPDPLNVVQSPLQLEIANSLAAMLRNGTFSGDKFASVIGVGHSYGSIITQGITAQYPSTFDAAILTGFSANSSAVPTFIMGLNLALANENNAIRFGTLNNGYLVSGTQISTQIGFFRFPGFDPAILAAAEATKGTTTFGELFTIDAVIGNAASFLKPVAVVDGAEDLPFCFGNCSYPVDHAQQVHSALYRNLSDNKFKSYLAPVTGHALNLHYAATDSFEWIQNFIHDVFTA